VIEPTFQGELMLAGWAETHNGGAKVTFWLPDTADLDTFRGLTVKKGNTAGQRFAAVLVEIGDDEQPKQNPAAVPTTSAEPSIPSEGSGAPSVGPPKGGPLARLAGQWCADETFRRWLVDEFGVICEDEARAAEVVREACIIKSRAELDSTPTAAVLFNDLFREPYMAYLKARG